ncbi:MAG: FAD-dependent oxidoreductase [Candidatus Pacebacteria bacterium]|nr:FAD-dependent oxidoreductase [Candidatus Paceibacterota bacterium]
MNHQAHKKHHLAIVGMGFAGLHAYLTLIKKTKERDNIDVTIISAEDSFTFIPMIHEVATGLLRPDSIVDPLRNVIGPWMREYVEGRATAIDLEKKEVHVALPDGLTSVIPYDTVIVATGSVTNFMNVSGAERYSYQLKTLEDAKLIKNKILGEFEDAADRTRAGQKPSVDVVVVGGGASGVEVAGELSDFMEVLSNTFCDVKVAHSITLLDGGAALVKGAHAWISQKAYDILTKRSNVRVRLNMRVLEVTEHGVKTQEAMVPSTLTIWTAGVKASELEWKPARVVDEKSRRIPVTSMLSLQGHDDVYVLGDQALAYDAACPYPMRAQIAVMQGKATAQNILRKLRGEEQIPFEWNDKGFILSLGEGGAVAEVLGIHFSGPFAWWVYRTAYLFSLVGVRAKLRTALEWTINLFKKRDLGKV